MAIRLFVNTISNVIIHYVHVINVELYFVSSTSITIIIILRTTAHNVYLFAAGGREPVTLRSLVRHLPDIATQVDITCQYHL